MENYVHLVLEDPTQTLSEMMRRLSGDYAQRFNRKSGGWVTSSKTGSKAVPSRMRRTCFRPSATCTTTRQRGVCPAAEYPWSSYREYVGPAEIADTRLVLDMLGGPEGFIATVSLGRGVRIALTAAREIPKAKRARLRALCWANCRPRGEDAAQVARNEALQEMRNMGLSVRQIERLTA